MYKFPYIFFDTDPHSETQGTWCVRDEGGSTDGLTLQEAGDLVLEQEASKNV